MTIFEQIQSDMYGAMKNGDKTKAGTLRITLAKLKDKRIEKQEDLTDEETMKILRTLVKQWNESVELYEKGGRSELASAEQEEIKILNGYLPQMMSKDEIKAIVQSVADDVGATSMADMGKVMPKVMKLGKGLIDGKSAQQFLQEILG